MEKNKFESSGDIDFIEDFSQEEETALEKLPQKTKSKRLKNALAAITVSLGLMFGSAAMGAEKEAPKNEEGKSIDEQIKLLQEKKAALEKERMEKEATARNQELNNYLKMFNVDGLTLGKPANQTRGIYEQCGIYLKGNHLGDIDASKSKELTFSKADFISAVSNTLLKNNITFKIENPELQVNIDNTAQNILKQWGGKYDQNTQTLSFGPNKPTLNIDTNTKEAQISGSGTDTITLRVTNKDGSGQLAVIINGNLASLVDIPAK